MILHLEQEHKLAFGTVVSVLFVCVHFYAAQLIFTRNGV